MRASSLCLMLTVLSPPHPTSSIDALLPFVRVFAATAGASEENLVTATAAILAALIVQSMGDGGDLSGYARTPLVSLAVADRNGSSWPLHLRAMVQTGVSDDLATIESACGKLATELRDALLPAEAKLQSVRMDPNPNTFRKAGRLWKEVVQRLCASPAASREHAATEREDDDVETLVNTLIAVATAGRSTAAAAASTAKYLIAVAEAAGGGLLSAGTLSLQPSSRPTRETLAALADSATRLQETFGAGVLQPILHDAQLATAIVGLMSADDGAGAGAERNRRAAAAGTAPESALGRAGAGGDGSAGDGEEDV